MNNLVSVVIPIFNGADTIKRCLETVILQSLDQPIEIIVVNNGSTDKTLEVIKKCLEENPDWKKYIVQIINQENSGAPAARNRGAQEAKGEYIIFVDADTICYPKMILEMRQVLENNLGVSFVYSQFRFGFKKIKSHPFDIELLKKVNYIDTTSLIRRSDLVKFDESLKRFQDWDLYLTMVEQGKKGVFIKKVLFKKQIPSSRRGINISNWLPSFMFKLPWKIKKVKDYELSREIIFKKHGLI